MSRVLNIVKPIVSNSDSRFDSATDEIVANVIELLGPTITPFLSRAKCEWVDQQVHEWEEYFDGSNNNEPLSYRDQMSAYIQFPKKRITVQETRRCIHSSSKRCLDSLRGRIMQAVALECSIEASILNDNTGSQLAASDNNYAAKTATLEAIIKQNSKVGTGGATVGGWDESKMTFVPRRRAPNAESRELITLDDVVDISDQIAKSYSSPNGCSELWMNHNLRDTLFIGNSNEKLRHVQNGLEHKTHIPITRGIDFIRVDSGQMLCINSSPNMSEKNANMFNIPPRTVSVCYRFRNRRIPCPEGTSYNFYGVETNYGLKLNPEISCGALYDRK